MVVEKVTKRRSGPRLRQVVVRAAAGLAGAVVLGVLARETPALVRYAKIRAM
ncbi:hypothetical protein [Saccharomonospora sp. NB11]|jgi:hypothetical protein|uniref:hypothetical protein n=1 Tax=Saccharomonospora sp. NB11 TaxID=1642298 RepID=UPI0018D07EE9|nr:hypothetical protein [Saccharomonospora sp. NB11]